jgi:hypothetical protein
MNPASYRVTAGAAAVSNQIDDFIFLITHHPSKGIIYSIKTKDAFPFPQP